MKDVENRDEQFQYIAKLKRRFSKKELPVLSIGTNKDTAEFVKDNIDYHWNTSIKNDYPKAKKMLILCDGGGSNSSIHYVVK